MRAILYQHLCGKEAFQPEFMRFFDVEAQKRRKKSAFGRGVMAIRRI
jgi:hypothetical protein